jgi:hypothetical protein
MAPPVAGRGAPGAGRGAAMSSAKSGSSTSDQAAKKKVTIKMEGKHEASDEVIVGELDEAIGGGLKANMANSDDYDDSGRPSLYQDETAAAPNPSFSIADTYDSDSSAEERKVRRQKPSYNALLQPSRLPFPEAPVPVGIGPAPERQALYDFSADSTSDGLPVSSPFVDVRDEKNKKREQESWFLFQFPTRLPFDTVVAPTVVSSAVVSNEEIIPMNTSEVSEVSIPLVLPNSFDNTMGSKAGKLGRLLVYKSGKTVLDMGGTKLIVSEGLPCGFAQQAVAIDTENSNYIPLGLVRKTVVVTPNVESAFIE